MLYENEVSLPEEPEEETASKTHEKEEPEYEYVFHNEMLSFFWLVKCCAFNHNSSVG